MNIERFSVDGGHRYSYFASFRMISEKNYDFGCKLEVKWKQKSKMLKHFVSEGVESRSQNSVHTKKKHEDSAKRLQSDKKVKLWTEPKYIEPSKLTRHL